MTYLETVRIPPSPGMFFKAAALLLTWAPFVACAVQLMK
jgi:hypothetical protein